MIRYLKHEEIDKTRWDHCLEKSHNGLVYASSWFLDTVSPGWEALVKDDYQEIFPLTQRKKWGISYLFQPAFTQQLGLFSPEPQNEISFNEYLAAIPEKYKLIEIQLNYHNRFPITTPGFTAEPRLTHHLNLAQDAGHLHSAYSENNKRNLRKAEGSSVQLTNEIHIAELVRLFLQNKGKHIETLNKHDYILFAKLTKEANARGLLEITGARSSEGTLHAGAVFLRSFREYIFLFSATDAIGREQGSMSAIIHSFVSRHAGESMILDFEGSMNPSLARFYKSFGSKEIVYLQIRKNVLPGLLRWLKN